MKRIWFSKRAVNCSTVRMLEKKQCLELMDNTESRLLNVSYRVAMLTIILNSLYNLVEKCLSVCLKLKISVTAESIGL